MTVTANPERSDTAATKSRQIDGLSSPDQLPGADVVIFDGQCNFCTDLVRSLKWFDGRDRLAYVSLHNPWVKQHVADLSHEQLMQQMYVVPRSDSGNGVKSIGSQRYGGAEAVRYLSTRLPKLWLAAPFLHIPFTMPIWQWGYRLIANHRYRIAGKNGDGCDPDGTCELHLRK